jgi:hypothetical protein
MHAVSMQSPLTNAVYLRHKKYSSGKSGTELLLYKSPDEAAFAGMLTEL